MTATHTRIQRLLACLAIVGAMLAVSWRPRSVLDFGPVTISYVGGAFASDTVSECCPFFRSTPRGVMVEGICVRTSRDGLVQVRLPGWESHWLTAAQVDQSLVDEFRRQWDKAEAIVKSCQPSGTSWTALGVNYGDCKTDL